MSKRLAALVAGLAVFAMGLASPRYTCAQARLSGHPDLSGRWRLNPARSENAQANIDPMQAQGHGMIVRSSFTLTDDGDRVVLAAESSAVRNLRADGRKEAAARRDVHARWDGQRLVVETAFGDTRVIEIFARSSDVRPLIHTSKAGMRGHEVSVRRGYDAVDGAP